MQSSGGPAGSELSEDGNRVSSGMVVEVNLITASLSNDIDSFCLHVNQNSVISTTPRQYLPDGSEGK